MTPEESGIAACIIDRMPVNLIVEATGLSRTTVRLRINSLKNRTGARSIRELRWMMNKDAFEVWEKEVKA